MKLFKLLTNALILTIISICTSGSAWGQTIPYKHVATISENGQRSRGSKGIRYYTFTNEKRTVYSSDEEGYSKKYSEDPAHTDLGYIFIKDKDGYHYYEHPDIHHKIKNTVPVNTGSKYADQYANNMNSYMASSLHEAAVKIGKMQGAVLRFNNDFSKINIYPYTTTANGSQLPQVTEVWEIYYQSETPFYE